MSATLFEANLMPPPNNQSFFMICAFSDPIKPRKNTAKNSFFIVDNFDDELIDADEIP
jgi:hypothetical protein